LRRGPRSVPVLMFAALAMLDLTGPMPAAELVLESVAGVALGAALVVMVRHVRPRREPEPLAVVLRLPVPRDAPDQQIRPEAVDPRV
jgi:hypothetical protein